MPADSLATHSKPIYCSVTNSTPCCRPVRKGRGARFSQRERMVDSERCASLSRRPNAGARPISSIRRATRLVARGAPAAVPSWNKQVSALGHNCARQRSINGEPRAFHLTKTSHPHFFAAGGILASCHPSAPVASRYSLARCLVPTCCSVVGGMNAHSHSPEPPVLASILRRGPQVLEHWRTAGQRHGHSDCIRAPHPALPTRAVRYFEVLVHCAAPTTPPHDMPSFPGNAHSSGHAAQGSHSRKLPASARPKSLRPLRGDVGSFQRPALAVEAVRPPRRLRCSTAAAALQATPAPHCARVPAARARPVAFHQRQTQHWSNSRRIAHQNAQLAQASPGIALPCSQK